MDFNQAIVRLPRMTAQGRAASASFPQLAVLAGTALALRSYTFGDPNLFIDEAFYFAAGNAMHHGALPYIDVWDRKPFGLFALYAAIASLSASPVAYQATATLFAVLTAWVIAFIVRLWSGQAGALAAGVAYLFLLSAFQGFGGQSPVFYNLFIAFAAWQVARALPELRAGNAPPGLALGMLGAGLAITIKTTAIFEAAFLGAFALFALPVGQRAHNAFRWMALGAAPTLLIAAGYALGGHWSEYWQAMTGANLAPGRWQPWSAQIRMRLMLAALAPILTLAVFGLLDMRGESRWFVALWALAALAGLAAFPYFHLHYALPLLVPLCVAAGAYLTRPRLGPIALAAACLLAFRAAPAIDPSHTAQSRQAMERIAQTIQAHGGDRGLFVFAGPPMLYTMTGNPFPSPLAFPAHLYHAIERNVSHLDTALEVRRVLAARPGVIITTREPRDGPINAQTYQIVSEHIRARCRLVTEANVPERLRTDRVQVWGDCH